MTSELADPHAMIQIILGAYPQFKDGKDSIRLSKALTGQQLFVEKRFCNCCNKILFIPWSVVLVSLSQFQRLSLTSG